jgi:hypothetical protein
MPIVEYFDQGTQSRKKKEFGYGAMGEEKSRKFLALQKGNAAVGGYAPPKMTKNKMEGERHSDTMKKEGPGVGVKSKESPKEKEKRHQDYDQKELDKNKPSEAKTPKKEKVYLQKKKDPDKKITVGYGGPDYLGMWSG